MRDLKLCKCGKIIEKTDKYCKNCKIEEEKKIIEYKRRYNKRYDKYVRDKKTTTFYHSAAWVKLTNLVKSRENELCLLCFENNKIKKGRVTHHIIPVKDVWMKRFDLKNCIYVCDECHELIHKEYNKDTISKCNMQKKLKQLILKNKNV